MSLGAILLAGGRASRLGGAAKPLLDVGGRTLLSIAVAAATDAGARPVTVVAPPLDETLPVDWVREEPPFSGPAAGIVAAVASWPSRDEPEWALVLACDLPFADRAVEHLRAAAALIPADHDGVCLGDASSRPQWLVGMYRTHALRRAASALPDAGRGAPVHALLADLAITVVATGDAATADIDTWEDLREIRRTIEEAP